MSITTITSPRQPQKHMKPRIILSHTTLSDGGTLELHEHDGNHYLHVHGQQLAGPATRISEDELAKLGTHPFRPARQPKILLLGLGLGGLLNAVCAAVPQKRATFSVYEPMWDLIYWQKKFFPEGAAMKDSRVKMLDALSPSLLAKENGTLHAILMHADTAPTIKNKTIIEDKRWLGAARDALQNGGLLGITAMRPIPSLFGLLKRHGFDVAEHCVEGNTNAKKPRRYPIWLARKGSPEEK